MPHPALEHRPQDARVSLGIPELDRMLEGGLMPHRPYLLVGPSGTGKTTLALQFLCEGIRRGERGLYVTLEDPPNEVRWDHRALRPNLDAVDVFDAIPDVMRYERIPFKDISAVRQVVPFGRVSHRIRLTPEFSSVEVTGTALEQMLRSEVQKHGYVRLVIDSLTALQYFCMKGFDPTTGAQTFLRFLTDLRTTTLLTVEAPLEDVESPERMLARGEIRLFRWELDGATVRAIGVEKFRGSAHDVRLHPYRIGSTGLDIQLAETISRDTRRIVEPALTVTLASEQAARPALPEAAPRWGVPAVEPEPLSLQIRDLVTVGIDITPLRSEVEAALEAVRASESEVVAARMARISAMAISLGPVGARAPPIDPAATGPAAQAMRRTLARAERVRAGQPPTDLPSSELLVRELETILNLIRALPAPAGPAAASAVGVFKVAGASTAPLAPEAAAAARPTPELQTTTVERTEPVTVPGPPGALARDVAPGIPEASPTVTRADIASARSGSSGSAPSAGGPTQPGAAPPPGRSSGPLSPEVRHPAAEPPTPAPVRSVSAATVARAAALLGEPIAPVSAEPDRPAAQSALTGSAPGSSGRPSRPRLVPPLSETPPLPRPVASPSTDRSGVASAPGGPGPAGGTAPVTSAGVVSLPVGAANSSPPATEGPAPVPKAPPRRRRRTSAKTTSEGTVPPEPLAPLPVTATGELPALAAPKPRRRVARRKKAPPVVAVAPDLTPPETAAPPSDAAKSPPPEASPPAPGGSSGGPSSAEGG